MELNNICKKYKDANSGKNVLNNINLKFKNTGLVFIVGKSGSGKTTLLNIISGFETATSGKLIISNEDILKFDNQKLNDYRYNNIGYIAQDYHLINDFTVKENILLGINNNINENSEEFISIIKELRIDSLLNKKVVKLSGGEKQRVAVARVLLRKTSIVLADEPTGNLDNENSSVVFEYLKKMSKEKLVIVVSHDEISAKKYGDRIIRISQGEIVGDTEKDILLSNEDIHTSFESKSIIKTNNLFHFALKFVFLKKLVLVLSIFLCSISFGSLTAILSMNYLDINPLVNELITNDEDNYFLLNKSVIKYKGSSSEEYNLPIKKEELSDAIDEFSLSNFEYQYDFYWNFYNEGSDFAFLKNMFTGITMVNNADFLSSHNWNMGYGKLPENSNEFALTDYSLFCFAYFRNDIINSSLGHDFNELKSNNELKQAILTMPNEKLKMIFGDNYLDEINKEKNIIKIRNNPGLLLIGDEFPISDRSDKTCLLVGSVNTNLVNKYEHILFTLNKNYTQTNEDMARFNFEINHGANSFISVEGFEKNTIDRISFNSYSGSVDCIASLEKLNDFGFDETINENEIIMNESKFRKVFQSNYDSSKSYKYSIEYIKYNDSSYKENIIYSKEYSVKRVFKLTNAQKEFLGDFDISVINTSAFNDYKEAIFNGNFSGLCINKNEINKINTNSNFYTKNNYSIYSLKASSFYFAKKPLDSLSNILLPIGYIIGFIGYSLVVVLFILMISKRKRDIGIMKSLGISNSNLTVLLGICATILFSILFIISIISTISFLLLFNSLMLNQINSYGNIISSPHFILQPNFIVILIILSVTIFVFLLTTFISSKRMIKVSPMDAIRSL